MVPIDGVDYSSTPNANWTAVATALKARGKNFAGRYVVSDKSPNGRGITADEYQALTAAGIDTFVYWEGSPSWMLGGEAAGIAAAMNAQGNLVAAGMPVTMPIFFAHDIDPEERHFDAVDACLRGAAKVIGDDRVALYGGWSIIDHCASVGTAKRFCQTVAWEYGRGVHPAACLYQYDTRNPAIAPQNRIAGIDCDMVRALKDDYGQASAFVNQPPIPNYPDPAPITWKAGEDTGWFDLNGQKVYAMRGSHVQAKKQTVCRTHASASAPKARANLNLGDKAIAIGSFAIPRTKPNGKISQERWLVLDDLSRVRASSMTPMFPIKP